MKIPKYILDILSRAKYEFDFCVKNEKYAAGYTICITKSTEYTTISTFNKEIVRLVNWVNKQVSNTAFILYVPNKTKHTKQFAIVTIFDPVMQKIENYIRKEIE